MKKNVGKLILIKSGVYLLTLFLLVGLFMACHHENKSKVSTTEQIKTKIVYTCEMDTEIILNKPGKCPKCGMELIKKSVVDTSKAIIPDTQNK